MNSSSTLLATLWIPSLNPVGAPSIVAFFLGILGIALTENWNRSSPPPMTPVWILIVPLLLFGFVYASPAYMAIFKDLSLSLHWKSRSFPNADDFCANYICLAFAMVISARIWRFKNIPLRVVGTFESICLAATVIAEFIDLYGLKNS